MIPVSEFCISIPQTFEVLAKQSESVGDTGLIGSITFGIKFGAVAGSFYHLAHAVVRFFHEMVMLAGVELFLPLIVDLAVKRKDHF